jgi:hypothetical protein
LHERLGRPAAGRRAAGVDDHHFLNFSQPCVAAGNIGLSIGSPMVEQVIEPCARCALVQDCIYPPKAVALVRALP